jgi:hypothetical protein
MLPKDNELYFFIRSTGEIGRSYDRGEPDDIKRKYIGNYFKSATEADEWPLSMFFHALRHRSSRLSLTSAVPLFPLVSMLIRLW